MNIPGFKKLFFLLLATAALARLPDSARAGLLFVGNTFDVGTNSFSSAPTCVATADVNHDGKLDLITVNQQDNSLTVLTNSGGGKFGFQTNLPVGNSPQFVVAANLKITANDLPDLVCANYSSDGTATIYTNNGSGKFGLNATLAVGPWPYCIAVADVNGDGKPDLIAANSLDSGTLTVLTNNGHGGFGLNATLPAGSYPQFVVAADLNGDNKIDLVCANQNDGTLTVLTNDHNTGFLLDTNILVGSGSGSSPYCVAVGDLNADGKPDLISANESDGTLTVLTNGGNGHFISSTDLYVGDTFVSGTSSQPYYVAAVDSNGDGRADLVSVNNHDNTLTVLTNDGRGGFAWDTDINAGTGPYCVAVADLNNDGKLDLACVNNSEATLTALFRIVPPALAINQVAVGGGYQVVISWSSWFTNFSVQTNVNLRSPNWQTASVPVSVVNGTNMSATLTAPPAGNLFFRLGYP